MRQDSPVEDEEIIAKHFPSLNQISKEAVFGKELKLSPFREKQESERSPVPKSLSIKLS